MTFRDTFGAAYAAAHGVPDVGPSMITLAQIQAAGPCEDGWAKILAADHLHGGDYDKPFRLVDALETNSLDDVLWALRCLPEHGRLWRLYAVWCARQVQGLMTDPRSVAALDVAERHARGNATDEDLAAAWDAARAAAWAAARAAGAAGAAWDAAWDAARAAQQAKLTEILTAGDWK